MDLSRKIAFKTGRQKITPHQIREMLDAFLDHAPALQDVCKMLRQEMVIA